MIQTAIDRQAVGASEETAVWCDGTVGNRLAGSETILLVEDENFVREVTGEVLRSAGYRVLSAGNANEALGTYEEHGGAVDLLLTDVILPGETGCALAARLRWGFPELKVLLISGYAQPMGLAGAGAEECLAKPFSAATLLLKVRKVLELPGAEET